VNKAKLQLGVEIVEVAIKIGFLSLVVFSGSTEMILGYSLLAFGLGILKTGLVFRLIAKLK
jgi:hypothetical protein